MKDVFDMIHIRHRFFVAAGGHATDRNLPFAHRESILFLTLYNVLICDDLCGREREGITREDSSISTAIMV
jgi:hypothetical protein